MEPVRLRRGEHVKCPHCGHEEKAYAVQAVPIQGRFGAASAFCTPCERCESEFEVTAEADGFYSVRALRPSSAERT